MPFLLCCSVKCGVSVVLLLTLAFWIFCHFACMAGHSGLLSIVFWLLCFLCGKGQSGRALAAGGV
jgi:hypothetical protein